MGEKTKYIEAGCLFFMRLVSTTRMSDINLCAAAMLMAVTLASTNQLRTKARESLCSFIRRYVNFNILRISEAGAS
jgi:hypothetical protein